MIDPAFEEYSERHTTEEPDFLHRLYRETHLTQVYPQMLSGNLQGTFLRMMSAMARPKRILEIGTFTGYSAIQLALGMRDAIAPVSNVPSFIGECESEAIPSAVLPDPACRFAQQDAVGQLHTIEVNPEQEDLIRKYIGEAGLTREITLHIGDALQIIPLLDETWDLVFIDADKPNYLNYYQLVLPKLRKGGFIIADNVLWDGKVLRDPSTMDKDTLGIHQFNETIQNDPRVENVMLPIRDGLMIVRKL